MPISVQVYKDLGHDTIIPLGTFVDLNETKTTHERPLSV